MLGMVVKKLPLGSIRIDGDTQARAGKCQETIEDYAELMKSGHQLPSIVVFEEDGQYWLADGFHRYEAAKRAGLTELECEVQTGSLIDAQWFACGANSQHGLRRTQADKRCAIEKALKHPVGRELSNNAIADYLGVDHKTVGRHRGILESTWEIPKLTHRLGLDGRVRAAPGDSPESQSNWFHVRGRPNSPELVQRILDAVPDVGHRLWLEVVREAYPQNSLCEQLEEFAWRVAENAVGCEIGTFASACFDIDFIEYFRLCSQARYPDDTNPVELGEKSVTQLTWEDWIVQGYLREFYFSNDRFPGYDNLPFWTKVNEVVLWSREFIHEHNRLPSWPESHPVLDLTEAAAWWPTFIRDPEDPA